MALATVSTGLIKCSFGLGPPVPLTAIPKGTPVLIGGLPAATIMDFVPMANIPTMGMCSTPSNPAVAAATAAALGVLTPMPCIPVTVAPWVPGSPTVLINNFPALNNTSTCMCTWGGVITITLPGQVVAQVP